MEREQEYGESALLFKAATMAIKAASRTFPS
jgi:hypothetical protein